MLRRLLFVVAFFALISASGTAFAAPEPTLGSPANGATAISPNGYNFSWTPTATVDSYRLQFSLDSTFSVMLFNYTVNWAGLTTTTRYCAGLPGSRTIYWRVVALIGFNQYTSATRYFTTSADGEAGSQRVLTVTSIVGSPSPSGSQFYNTGTAVDASNMSIYTPEGASGERYLLLGWIGSGSVPDTGTSNLVSFVMYRTSSLTWSWRHEYLLTVSTENGLGVISFLGTGWREAGSQITITNSTPTVATASPDIRWKATGYRGTGSVAPLSTDLSVTFNINLATTIVFSWAYQYKMTVNNPVGYGNPYPPAGENWFDDQERINFRVAPIVALTGGYYLKCLGWTGYGVVPASGDTFQGSITMTEPGTIIWTWGNQYDLIVNSEFGKTTGNYSGTFDEGTVLSVGCAQYHNETGDIRYECRGWDAVGSILGGDGLFTGAFTLYAPTTITWKWFKQYRILISSNLGTTSPSGHIWADENSFLVMSAFPPSDTVDTRFFWDGWIGDTIQGPTGNLNEAFQITSVTFFTAIFRTQYYISVTTLSGMLEANYSGWYFQGKSLAVTAIPPDAAPGYRYTPGWSGTGSGSVNMPADGSAPATVNLVANSPIIQRSYWVFQVSFEIIVPQGHTQTIPPVGMNWYSVGDLVSGYAPYDVNGIRCLGFTGTGSLQSSDLPWFSFTIQVPSTATFLYDFPEPAPEFSWTEPSTIASKRFGKALALSRKFSDGSPIVVFHNPETGTIESTYFLGGRWYSARIDTIGSGDTWISLTVDNTDIAHVAYYDVIAGQLKYAFFDSNVWRTRTIDPASGAGRFNDIVTDRFGNIFVAYYNSTNSHLYFARSGYASAAGKGEQWAIELVDNAANVGMYCSIAVSELWSVPHIAYYDSTNADLKYAYKPHGSVFWNIERAHTEGDAGINANIVVDRSGRPAIACQQNTVSVNEVGLIFCVRRDEGWVTNVLDSTNATGFNLSLAIDLVGNFHISYHNYGDLYYARFNGLTWSINKLTDGADTMDETCIALDASGNPGIAYWNAGDLLYKDVTVNHFDGEIVNYYPYTPPPPPPDENEGAPGPPSSGGCFIATAAFGSYCSDSLISLTSLRDNELSASRYSSSLVGLYYAFSPAVSRSLSGEAVKCAIRELLVR